MTDDAQALLHIYLRDHHAAAAGGRALARRCASSNEGTPLGDFLCDEFVPALDVDTDVLDRVFAAVGIVPSMPKQLAVRAAEVLGRLKLNGRFTGYSPLSRVIELEGLIAGVQAKRRLWAAVEIAGQQYPEMGFPKTGDRDAAASDQIKRLEEHHGEAVEAAFGSAV